MSTNNTPPPRPAQPSTPSSFVELCEQAGSSLLPLLSTVDAVSLRSTCRALRVDVTEHPWADAATPIFNLPSWRACFPRARAARLELCRLRASDLALLAGVATVHMKKCALVDAAAGAAFPHLSLATALHFNMEPDLRVNDSGASVQALTAALSQQPFTRLTELRVGRHRFSDVGMVALAAALRQGAAPRLNALEITFGSFPYNGFVAFVEALRGGAVPLLTSLNLGNMFTTFSGVVCAQAIGEGLAGVPLLASLDVSHVNLWSDGALALSQRLSCVPRLQRLNLRGDNIGDAGLQSLSAVLRQRCLRNLLSLDLGENALTAVGVSALAAALSSGGTPLLTELSLGSNKMRCAGMDALASSLHGVPRLELLDVRDSRIADEGFRSLASALRSRATPSLSSLLLRSNELDDRAACELSAGLECTPLLKDLDLSDNCIGDIGVSAIAAVMLSLPALTRLGLSNNGVSAEGVAHLAAALTSGRTPNLIELDLSQNALGDAGVKSVTSALVCVPRLQVLDLSDIFCDDVVAIFVAAALHNMPSLRRLNLALNEIGDAGASALANHLAEAPALQWLDASDNPFVEKPDATGCSALAALATKARKIRLFL